MAEAASPGTGTQAVAEAAHLALATWATHATPPHARQAGAGPQRTQPGTWALRATSTRAAVTWHRSRLPGHSTALSTSQPHRTSGMRCSSTAPGQALGGTRTQRASAPASTRGIPTPRQGGSTRPVRSGHGGTAGRRHRGGPGTAGVQARCPATRRGPGTQQHEARPERARGHGHGAGWQARRGRVARAGLRRGSCGEAAACLGAGVWQRCRGLCTGAVTGQPTHGSGQRAAESAGHGGVRDCGLAVPLRGAADTRAPRPGTRCWQTCAHTPRRHAWAVVRACVTSVAEDAAWAAVRWHTRIAWGSGLVAQTCARPCEGTRAPARASHLRVRCQGSPAARRAGSTALGPGGHAVVRHCGQRARQRPGACTALRHCGEAARGQQHRAHAGEPAARGRHATLARHTALRQAHSTRQAHTAVAEAGTHRGHTPHRTPTRAQQRSGGLRRHAHPGAHRGRVQAAAVHTPRWTAGADAEPTRTRGPRTPGAAGYAVACRLQ